MCYHGHKQEVRLLLPLGDQLISVDGGGDFIVWDVQGGGKGAGLHKFPPVSIPSPSYYPSCLAISLRRLLAAAL